MNYRPHSKELSPRYQLDCDELNMLVQFETENAMIYFIQNELPPEVEYETRTLH
jgi:hypothetical protein